MSMTVAVLVATPAHSSVSGPLTYLSERTLAPGTLVRVPLGRREVLGLVWEPGEPAGQAGTDLELRPVTEVLDGIAPLTPAWRQLVAFAGRYYQRSAGEVALAALPPRLRAVVVLRDVYDLPHEAIAAELGISVSAAKVRLHRARLKLRSDLFPEIDEVDVRAV